MLDKELNNKCLFKKENKTNDAKRKIDRNIVDHADCICKMEKLFMKLKNKDDDYIILNKKYENFHVENISLKIQTKELKQLICKYNYKDNNDMDFGEDIETLYIKENIDIISKKKIKYYEYQLAVLNTFFKDNNINSLIELKNKITTSIPKNKNN
jgi:hypothetical protein